MKFRCARNVFQMKYSFIIVSAFIEIDRLQPLFDLICRLKIKRQSLDLLNLFENQHA